jgi:flagellin
MALTLGESHASTHKSLQYLNSTRAEIEKVQLRLSSGNKIVSPADDVGGLAVAMKLQHQLTTTSALASNVDNAKSYTDMQYTALTSAVDIVEQMRELKVSYDNAATDEQASLEGQFNVLKSQLESLSKETAGSENLFRGDQATFSSKSVNTSSTGSTITLQAIQFGTGASDTDSTAVDLDQLNSIDQGTVNITQKDGGGNDVVVAMDLDQLLQEFSSRLSSFQTQAASDQSTLGFASDYLNNMAVSIEAAHGRIMDVDVAEETINLSKLNLQQEAALAAIVQANLAMESVLELLISRND